MKDAAKRKSDSCSVSSFVLTVDMLNSAESGCSDHEQNGGDGKQNGGDGEHNTQTCKENGWECKQNEQNGTECEQIGSDQSRGKSGEMERVGDSSVVGGDFIVGRGSDSAIGSEAMGDGGSSVGGGGDSAMCSGDEAMGSAVVDEWGGVGGVNEGGDDAVGNRVLDLVGRDGERDSDDVARKSAPTGGRDSAGWMEAGLGGEAKASGSPGECESSGHTDDNDTASVGTKQDVKGKLPLGGHLSSGPPDLLSDQGAAHRSGISLLIADVSLSGTDGKVADGQLIQVP